MNYADRVQESTTATSTATIALAGALTGFRTFTSALVTGAVDIPVCVADSNGNWEIGLYTLTNPTTLTRQTITSSSNAGAAVTFPAGAKNVFATVASDQIGKLPAAPFSAPLLIGFAGDSIAYQWGGQLNGVNVSQSPLFWAATELYPCDFQVVMNTGLGGSSSSQLLIASGATPPQISVLQGLATKPDIVVVQTLQNDFMGSYANADTNVANVTSYTTQALAAGVKLVVICSRPPKSGTDNPSALVYANRQLEIFCRNTKGTLYLDVFGIWRRNGVADAAGAGIPYQGAANTATAFSDDGTHPTPQAARAVAPLVVPILKQYARPIVPMPSANSAYDNVNAIYNNLFGPNGGMVGTGGLYNGVNNTNVAGNSATAQDRWELTDGSGVVATQRDCR